MSIEATDRMAKARAAKAAKAAVQVAPTLDIQPLTEEEAAKLTPVEIEQRRARLTALIDALPAPKVDGAKPGSITGTGLTAEYVPYNAKWFIENEELFEIIPPTNEKIFIQGVGFQLIAGRRCKLPKSHYEAYLDSLRRKQKLEEEYAPPTNPLIQPGYLSPVHRMPGTYFKDPIE